MKPRISTLKLSVFDEWDRTKDVRLITIQGTTPKPKSRLTDGSFRFRPVSIVLNNHNRPGRSVNRRLGFEVAPKQLMKPRSNQEVYVFRNWELENGSVKYVFSVFKRTLVPKLLTKSSVFYFPLCNSCCLSVDKFRHTYNDEHCACPNWRKR